MPLKYSILFFFAYFLAIPVFSVSLYKIPKDSTTYISKPKVMQPHAPPSTFNKKGNRLIDLGAGVALWYKSDQPQFENLRFPIHIFTEYGNSKKALSAFADFSFLTQFVQSDFVLKPMYLNLDLKFSFLKALKVPSNSLDIFALAGPTLWYASLTDRGYPGINDYENKIEKDLGIGLNAGMGGSFRFKNYKISAMFLYSTGKGQYYAGQFNKQSMYVGSYQAVLLFSYVFVSKNNIVHCPAYR